jgi:tetratricopeptide (TPR) repeat protein
VLTVLTWRQTEIGHDSRSLWTHAVQSSPSAISHSNLGRVRLGEGKREEAMRHFRAALVLNPEHARAHYNLGHTLRVQGRAEEAIGHLTAALRIRPDYPEAHRDLGVILLGAGRYDAAIEHFSRALAGPRERGCALLPGHGPPGPGARRGCRGAPRAGGPDRPGERRRP